MAGVGQQTAEVDVLGVRHPPQQNLSEVTRRVDSGTAAAAVDLEKDGQRDAAGGGELFDGAHRVGVIDEQVEVTDLGVEVGGAGDLLRGDRHRVGDVAETAGREGLGLGKGGDGETAEVEVGLDARRLDALVGLDVGTQAHTQSQGLLRHPRGVALEAIEIDQCCRVFGGRRFSRRQGSRRARF